MKITLAIPDELGRRFREAVPAGKRSALITRFLRNQLPPSDRSLEAVCRRVNSLKGLDHEMVEWECFDDQLA